MKKGKINESLEGLILPTTGFVSGGVAGTVDVLTTGLPLLSSYLEASALTRVKGIEDSRDDIFDVCWKGFVAGQIGYFFGVAIPFGIKYQNEIYSFIEGALK